MSTLNVGNIQSTGSGFHDVVTFKNSGGTENATLCRAWCHFTGTGTVSLDGDFNVDSITDIATGTYQVNFTNAMPNVNYSAVASSQNTLSVYSNATSVYNYNTTDVRIATATDGTGGATYTSYDATHCSLAVFA